MGREATTQNFASIASLTDSLRDLQETQPRNTPLKVRSSRAERKSATEVHTDNLSKHDFCSVMVNASQECDW